MNNNRRKQIEILIRELNKLEELADGIKQDIEAIKDEEQEYRDNMPENLQDGEKAQVSDSAIESLEECDSSMDEVLTGIQSTIESLNQATA